MTRGDVKTSLQALGYAADTDTAQNEAIYSTLRRVASMHRWPWQEVHTITPTLAAGSATVSITGITDILSIDSVRVENGTSYYDLEYAAPQELRRLLHLDRDAGVPEKWTKHSDVIKVYPIPDLAYIVTVDYVNVPAMPAADNTELPLPDTYDDIIKWGAVAALAYRERDWNAYNAADAQFSQRVREAWAAAGVKQRQSARHVVKSGVHTAASFIGPGSF